MRRPGVLLDLLGASARDATKQARSDVNSSVDLKFNRVNLCVDEFHHRGDLPEVSPSQPQSYINKASHYLKEIRLFSHFF